MEQPSQQFQGQFRTESKGGVFAGCRFHPRGFHHPHQPLPASLHCRGASLIFANFLMVAFLLVELRLVPLRCPARGEHRDEGKDYGRGQGCGAAETR
ncbi:hypothetical protein LRC484719_04280 [Mycobacterium riyadhense]